MRPWGLGPPWGPIGKWPLGPAGGQAGGEVPTLTPLVSTHLPKIAIPPGGDHQPQGCASAARNPKGSQITPFCHQMGRRATVWTLHTARRHRISARISLGGSHPLNLNFFYTHFGPQKWENANFWDFFEIAPHNKGANWGPMGPHGPHGAPWGPKGP